MNRTPTASSKNERTTHDPEYTTPTTNIEMTMKLHAILFQSIINFYFTAMKREKINGNKM